MASSQRTTLFLDEEARELAARYGCSMSEAIRRAILRAILRRRASFLGVPPESRQERVRLLKRLFELFEGNDPQEEIRRLKSEDEGF